MDAEITVAIKFENVAQELTYEQAQEMIKVIDKEQYDATFTMEMAEWFVTQVLIMAEDDDQDPDVKKLRKMLKGKK